MTDYTKHNKILAKAAKKMRLASKPDNEAVIQDLKRLRSGLKSLIRYLEGKGDYDLSNLPLSLEQALSERYSNVEDGVGGDLWGALDKKGLLTDSEQEYSELRNNTDIVSHESELCAQEMLHFHAGDAIIDWFREHLPRKTT